jgi:hypothetical protein
MAKPFQGDDVDDFEAARDDEGDVKQTGLSRTAKLSNFGAAFNAARQAGDKTFMFKGKKYTTEMAKPKAKAAPKAEPKAEAKPAAKDDTGSKGGSYNPDMANRMAIAKQAMNDYESQQGRFGSFKKGGVVKESSMMKKEGRGMAKADMQKVASKAVKKHEKTMHGMKSGGMVSKRADGCAIRGKTKGRMV